MRTGQNDGCQGTRSRLSVQDVEASRGANVRVEPVAVDGRSRRDIVDEELTKGCVVHAVNDAHSTAPETAGLVAFDGHDDRQLSTVLPSSALSWGPPAIEGLVNFDVASQKLTARVDGGGPQLGQHHPGRLVAPNTELALQRHCRDPILTGGEQPRRVKPDGQWCASAVEDGAGRDARA